MSSWKDGKKAQEEAGEFKWEDRPNYMPNHYKGGRDQVRSKYHAPAFAKPLTVKARFEKAQKELKEIMEKVKAQQSQTAENVPSNDTPPAE